MDNTQPTHDAPAPAHAQDIGAACLAVAGPVGNNEVTMTNRGRWVINGDKVGALISLICHLSVLP
jgi:glucokinase